jgi:hypothetical protein
LKEDWEDDGENRLEDERAWFISPDWEDESEDGNRASFSRWEKRSVISNHLPELFFLSWKRSDFFSY